jgi:arylsulfatase A-like enzyme
VGAVLGNWGVLRMSSGSDLTRREVLIGAVAGAAALAVGARAGDAKTASRPNILFILADDLGYADLSIYGRPEIKTPNIDSIGSDGLRFTQAYANSAVCSATRTALMTGRYQYRLRLGLEEPLTGNPDVGLPPEQPTLPSLLRKTGYGTTLIGKWHLGAPPKFGPLQSGYDHFYGFRGGALDYFTHRGPFNVEDLWDDAAPIHQTGYLTQLLGARAVATIEGYARARQPFLLSLHFNAPHFPWEAPGDQAEAQRLAGRLATDRRAMFDFDGGSQNTYRQMVEAMDREVGRVLQALEASGLAQNTLVTSDNGGERFSDTWPFTGRKTELLEGGLRIPALIRWPGHIPAHSVTDQVAISMDWLPTLLAAAGTTPDPVSPPDGVNLLPVLTANGAPVPRALFWRYKANAQRAAREGDYKFLKILNNTFLFNVTQDPMERANLKSREPQIYEQLVAAWHRWNADMLPEVAESSTDSFTGAQLADHIGSPTVTGKPDLGADD